MEDCLYRFKKSTEQSPAPSPKAGSADFLVNYRLERCQCSLHTLSVRSEKQLGILHAGCVILSFLRREIDQDRSLPGFARPRGEGVPIIIFEDFDRSFKIKCDILLYSIAFAPSFGNKNVRSLFSRKKGAALYAQSKKRSRGLHAAAPTVLFFKIILRSAPAGLPYSSLPVSSL